VPEGPSGAASCEANTGDEDGNNLANTADPKCARAAAFTELGTTGVDVAEAEDGIPAGTMVVVSVVVSDDPLMPFGPDQDYIWVPTGQNPFRDQAVYTGVPAGIYEIHILTRFESPSSAELWLKVDNQPFLGPPSNADADILNNRSPVLSPTWIQLGRTGSAANAERRQA
jgi:hypothetical protein